MDIHVLVLDGVFDMGLSAVLDTLTTANELIGALDSPVAPFRVVRVGIRKKVCTAQGLIVPVAPATAAPRPQAIVVPALGVKQPAQIIDALTRRDVQSACAWLRESSQTQIWIGAACTATFVLAESRLLDGHTATTSWWLAPLFRARHPRVAFDDSRMLVISAPFVTAGAAMAHFVLALSLVRSVSPALASMTARYLMVEPRASQANFVIPDHLAHADPIVEKFERWARRHLSAGFSLADAARSVGTSERTLFRRMKRALGKSPLSFFQDIRIQHAVHRLQTSNDSIEQIAASVGYCDAVTLRTLLRDKLGQGLREIRSRAG